MITNSYNVIGVMSGTSLDGVDLAYITFTKDHQWDFKIHIAETIPYSDEWLQILKQLLHFNLDKLQQIDADYTLLLSDIIKKFATKCEEIPTFAGIDAICSHGHTALHQPNIGVTYQIGNLNKLAKITNQTVVCDFRVEDVKLGGQGAPLVPIGDALLFSEFDFCLNLGGFANISSEINGKRIAFDICPVNSVMNHYMNFIGMDYDHKGQLATTGTVHHELLKQLNQLDFYKNPNPKSLGIEWVKTEILPLVDSFKLDLNDILRTFVAHIACQIANEINKKQNAKILVTGGGAYNQFLINQIKQVTKNNIHIPDNQLIEYKEALIFGLLGVLRLRNEINCLASVTGASKNHSTGKIYYP